MTDEHLIIADKNLENIYREAQTNRYDNWHVQFEGLNIYCHDLLALFTALKDIFLQRIYDFDSNTSRPRVIDGGAHIGIFSLYIKKKFPQAKVTAFEPEEQSLNLLMKNLIANGIRDVEVVPAGLFEKEGRIGFTSRPGDGSGLFGGQNDSLITVVPLSRYLGEEVDFLKLNIEGAEWGVLKEGVPLLRNVKRLTLEYHGFPELGQTLHGILALLDGAGFRYAIHDFDALTNSATKPPFRINAGSRFYLLVHGVRLDGKDRTDARCRGLGDICRVEPISRVFGLDLGTSICRYYIKAFLSSRSGLIRGRVLEVAENTYTKLFGSDVAVSDILHVQPSPSATIVGDLSTGENIPHEAFDCIILTQTLQCIKDFNAVLANCYIALKEGGTLLITSTGIGQISRYDMDRWGEYWRFTDRSLRELLNDHFPKGEVEVLTYGNVASAKAYLDGLPAEDLTEDILHPSDNDYQVLVCATAKKARNVTVNGTTERSGYPAIATGTKPAILLYHRVAEDELDAQMLCVSPAHFEEHLRILVNRFRPVPLRQLLDEIRQGTTIAGTVALTFDDGYLDNLNIALPLLERYRVHATVFVCTGELGSRGGFWGDKVENVLLRGRQLPDSLMVQTLGRTWRTSTYHERLKTHDELRSLLRHVPPEMLARAVEEITCWAGLAPEDVLAREVLDEDGVRHLASSDWIEVGAHAVTHANLAAMPLDMQRAELSSCKRDLEKITGCKVTLLAYPYGTEDSFSNATKSLAADLGFEAALAVTQSGISHPVDFYALPRRVTRNWNGTTFAEWLADENPHGAEVEMLGGRSGKLLNAQERAMRIRRADDPGASLRLVYINTHDVAGGAAKSTCNLVKSMRLRGHRADLLVGFRQSTLPAAHAFDPEVEPDLVPSCREKGLLFYEFQGSHRLMGHHLVQRADVVHLQNLHGDYFNPFSLSALSCFRPVVWTLRDMQAITGRCAHSLDCERWESGCGHCPDLTVYPAAAVDGSARLWRDKKEIYARSRLVVVCPSNWLKAKVERSILGHFPIEQVYNSVDTDVFKPYDRVLARRELNLPEDSLLIGAVAHGSSLKNPWKGGSFTLQALEALWAKHPDMRFVNIGVAPGPTSDLLADPRIIHVPHVAEEQVLAKLYSALDLYLYTPLADTCPLVVIEALACGLPVVSFATGGVPELVRQGIDGFVTPQKDIRALAKAAETLLRLEMLRNNFSVAARQGALDRFRLQDMAARYEAIYHQASSTFWHTPPQGEAFPYELLPPEVLTSAFLKAESDKLRGTASRRFRQDEA